MNEIKDYLINEEHFRVDQVKYALSKWDVKPLMFGDVQIGETMMQNNEIHFALNKSFRKLIGRKKMMHDVVDGLIEQHGFLVTKLYKNDKNKGLIELFGFKKTHEDKIYEYFWLDRETKYDRH